MKNFSTCILLLILSFAGTPLAFSQPKSAGPIPGTAQSAVIDFDDEFLPRTKPLCTPKLYGPGFDCDDYAYAFCQSVGFQNCWVLGLFWERDQNKFAHAVPVTRREVLPGFYQYCIYDPQFTRGRLPSEVVCWFSTSPVPDYEAYRDQILDAACGHYQSWSFPCPDNCGAGGCKITIWDPATNWCKFSGEPLWFECGSPHEVTRACNLLREGGGDLACWLPYSLLPCEDYYGTDAPGPWAEGPLCGPGNEGQLRACISSGSDLILTLQCHEGDWTPSPPVPLCSELVGQPCQIEQQSAIDCHGGGNQITLTTLTCEPCSATPLVSGETRMCWSR